ncbi:MAG: cytochrome c [Phenylobacterium sp.]
MSSLARYGAGKLAMAMNRGGNSRIAAALAVGLSVAAAGALAQTTQAADAPTTPGGRAAVQRHENFEKQGKAFKAIVDELKKDAPDKALVARNAALLRASAAQLPTWFPKGSGKEAWPKTDAKAEVWSDAAGFGAAAATLQAETEKLDQLSAAGDLEAIRAQVKATGAACKTCHDAYRVPKKT